jgi:hypothetical protein
VLHARVLLGSTVPLVDAPSYDFYFEATGSDVNIDFTATITPTTAIKAFFNTAAGGATHAASYYLLSDLDYTTNASKIEYYDVTAHLDGTPSGSPVRIDAFTLTGGGTGTGIPPGAAICIGYRRDYGTDIEHVAGTRPRARDRGRVYIGPLNLAASGTADGSVNSGCQTDMKAQFDALAATQNTGLASQFNLVQWSRKNASVGAVRWYFVDEGFCYQRRRGDDTSNRVHTWVAV